MKVFFLLTFLLYLSIASTKKVTGRIIGGHPTFSGQFPFAAAVYVRKSDSGTYFCGGTLIQNQWILTSGHCVESAVLFTIQLGSNFLTQNDPDRIILATSEFELHPEFDPVTFQHDVGLIKLRIPIEYTDYIREIRFLPTYTLQNGAPTIAIGWGQVSDQTAELSEELLAVNLTTISTSECKLFYGDQITDEMVCVNGNFNEGSCIGDMGSPLLQFVGREYYLIVGTASFISGNGCESLDPSGYTRTFSHIDWIKNVTGA